MQFRALTPVLGIEVAGIDLNQALDAAAFDAIHQAWLDHALLLFRGHALEAPALEAFSRRFGALELPPASAHRGQGEGTVAAARGVWIISNVMEQGRPIGALGSGEAEWHTDMSYLEEPPAASLLYSQEIPDDGGDTVFACMYEALAAMPQALRSRIEGRRARHDSAYTSAGELRKDAAPVTDVTATDAAVHPIIRTHPETGRQALFLGRRRNSYIEDMAVDDSEALLDDLWEYCADERFVYRHRWRAGDLLVWDNRAVIHRRDAFDPASRRIMLRTQIVGDRPR